MTDTGRPIVQNPSSEPAAQTQEKLDLIIEELQKQTVDKSLADSFPDWDLNPPAMLVRRRSTAFR